MQAEKRRIENHSPGDLDPSDVISDFEGDFHGFNLVSARSPVKNLWKESLEWSVKRVDLEVSLPFGFHYNSHDSHVPHERAYYRRSAERARPFGPLPQVRFDSKIPSKVTCDVRNM